MITQEVHNLVKLLSMLIFFTFNLIFLSLVAAQQNEELLQVTIEAVHQETTIQDIFGDDFQPNPGLILLVVDVSIKDNTFNPSAELPEHDGPLVQGVRFYSDAESAPEASFSLSNIFIYDSEDTQYPLSGFAIGSDVLIAPNLNDFTIAAPYEEVGYSFIFVIDRNLIDEPFVLHFEDLEPTEISLSSTNLQIASASSDTESSEGSEAVDEVAHVGIPVMNEEWQVMVTEVREESSIESMFMETYRANNSKMLLVVVADVVNLSFNPSVELPDSDTLVSGIHLYTGNSGPTSGKYDLSQVLLFDTNRREYSIVAWGVGTGRDYLIGSNLTDFSVASPSEESTYRFVFEVDNEISSEELEFQFDSLPRIRLSESEPSETSDGTDTDETATSTADTGDIELSETYHSESGLSLMYPQDWSVLPIDADVEMTIVTNSDNPEEPLASGEALLLITGPFPTEGLDVADTFNVIQLSTDVDEDELDTITIGAYSALRMTFNEDFGEGFGVIFNVNETSSFLAIGITNTGELTQFESLLLDIIASIAYVTPTLDYCESEVQSNANIRSGPGTNFTTIGSQNVGAGLQIIGKNVAGDWYKVRINDEEEGWIAAFLVNTPECPQDFELPTVEN